MLVRAAPNSFSSSGRRLLVLVGLCGFAIAQPVLSALGEEPAILVRHGIEGRSLIVIAVVIAFVPPVLLWAPTELISRASPRVGLALHRLIVGALVALFAIQLAKGGGVGRSVVLVLIALAAGVGFTVAYARHDVVAAWARYTVVLPALAVGFFTLASPASALLSAPSVAPTRDSVRG